MVAGTVLRADTIKLSTSPDGVLIDAGIAGQFTIQAPTLSMAPDDYAGRKPVITVTDPAHEVAKYPGGGEVDIAIDGSSINYTLGDIPSSALKMRFTTMIPISFGQGGRVAVNDAPFLDLPAQKAKNFVIQDTASKFRVIGPVGDGYSLVTPAGFHEVADNRFFNWPTFVHYFTFDLRYNPGHTIAFQVAGEPVNTGKAAGAATPRKYVVDRYGQLVSKAFPEKVTSDKELKDDIATEQAMFDKFTSEPRDSYGGVLGTGEKFHLKKTGFFQTGKIGSHDIFVTPEGNAFYQLAVCCEGVNDQTLVAGRERIYEWLPPKTGDFAPCWLPDNPGDLSFYTANWIRKFGAPFDSEKFSLQALTRLRKWGFNSAGCWSSFTDAMRQAHFPGSPDLGLQIWLTPGLTPMQGIGGMFDPFAPGTEEAINRAFAKRIAPLANDPTIIGYFLGNEQLFEDLPRLVPAQKSASPSKLRLVQMLRDKYKGKIAAFNAAWAPQTPFAGFDELKDAVLLPVTPRAGADMQDFVKFYLETYYEMVSRIFHKYDANHLLLGSRWQPGTANNEMLVRIASKYLDVISVNYYTYAINPDFLDRIHEWSGGKPMLMSEWSYSAPSQGQMGAGGEVGNQKERGLAYRNYVETTAAIPYIIGQQWFTYLDEPVTGRCFEGFNHSRVNSPPLAA